MITIQDIAKHHKKLIAICRYLGADKYLADDMVQDLYMKVCQMNDLSRLTYKDEVNFGFLFTVLKNAFIDIQRKKRYEVISLDSYDENNVSGRNRGHAAYSDYRGTNKIKKGLAKFTFNKISTGEEAPYFFEKDLLVDKCKQVVERLDFYPRELFKIYIEQPKSIRQLATETDISTTNIFYTLKAVRNEITKETKAERENYESKSARIRRYNRDYYKSNGNQKSS